MTKKELQSYKERKRELQNLTEMITELESRMVSPRGQQLTGMPSGGHDNDQMAGMVSRHLQLLERYRQKVTELTEAQMAIEDAIETLEPHERELFRRRYIQGAYWEDICVNMGYSWRQIHRIHSAALQKLDK